MSTQRIIGLVTAERGWFLCRTCQCEIEMIAIIDIRNPRARARVWKEAEPHDCKPFKPVEVFVHPNPHERKQ